MKNTTLIILGLILSGTVLVALAGIYKFNYLADQPGYDVDGNKIEIPKDKSYEACNEEGDRYPSEQTTLNTQLDYP